MSVSLYSGNIGIYYGQFYFETNQNKTQETNTFIEYDSPFSNQENGLCGAAKSDSLHFHTGFKDGIISLSVEQHHSTPPINDTFDEIVEVSFSHKENTITLAEWAHEKTYKLNIPKGNYRLRYSIKNMEKEYTENDDYTSPLDDQQYLIEIWPNDNNHIQDSIIKVTSDIAQYCHKTVTKEVKIQSSVEITVRKNGRFTCPQCNWSLVFIEAYKHCRNCGIEHILTNKTTPTKTYDSLLNTEIMSILPIASSVTPDNLWDTEGSEMHCLYLAVINKDKELINDFIAKGLDPNHTDTSGNTLLHTVIENSEKHDVIKFVVELNVNLNTLNNRNWSSLFLLRKTFTASKRNKELHQWLQEHGAKATPDLFKTAWK